MQHTPNFLKDSFALLTPFIVPESQYGKPLGFQPNVASGVVVFRFHMLATVEFDDKAGLETDEINDVMTNGLLSPKFECAKSFGAEVLP